MVVYKSKLIKTEPVYGEAENQIIEMWATFKIEEHEVEVFLDNFYVLPRKEILEGIGKVYDVDLTLMTHNIHRINIEEKMLKQITTFPKGPIYFFTGEIVDINLEKRVITVDSGIKIECGVNGLTLNPVVSCLREGDWVFVAGKMFGEILPEVGKNEGWG
jgi:sporulation protein YlmC with PRC-barrel domain